MKSPRLTDMLRSAQQTVAAAYVSQEPGLPLSQAVVLRALLENGPLTQTNLADASGVDRSTLAEMLIRMAAQNMVARARLETDQRAVLVTITPSGIAAIGKASAALDAAERLVTARVSRVMRPYFRQALEAIAAGKNG